MSLNHEFMTDLIGRHAGPGCRILDFGCGNGHLIHAALERGHDAYGCDRYDTIWERTAELAVHQDRISRLGDDGRMPFADASFDVVVANQVFEHLENLNGPLDEIHRVLKPGGLFLNCFPTSEVWWEGHLKAPFAHWFFRTPKRWRRYMATMHRLGIGKDRRGRTLDEWHSIYAHLPSVCFYRPSERLERVFASRFELLPSAESDWIRHRLSRSRSLSWLAVPRQANPVLRFLCTRLAGRVFVMRRPVAIHKQQTAAELKIS